MNIFYECHTGDVIFTMNPTVEYLNSESYQEILSTTWLMDEHTVNFASNVVLENVVLHKPITTAVVFQSLKVILWLFLTFPSFSGTY